MTKPLYLGVSRRVITPKIGTHLYGYAPGWPSTSVNDDLTLTAFYFKQEDTVSLLISLTVCSIAQELSDSMRTAIEERFGISKNACIIHAIHTHSGPNLAGSIGWGDLDTEYRDKILLPAFFDAVEEAIATPIPVTMAVTCGDSYIGINRRELAPDNTIVFGQNPWGVFDPRMTVIAFCKEDGKAFANLIHYAVHCTAAGKNPEITRDLAGVMIDTLEAETGAVTAFINGAEGDIGPRLTNGLTVGEGDIRYAMRLGAVAGQDAVRIYNQPRIYVTPELRVSYRRITIPYSKRIPLAEANEQYEKFRGETINVLGKQKAYYKSIIESYENGYEETARKAEKMRLSCEENGYCSCWETE